MRPPTCRDGNHDLVVLIRTGDEMDETVIRWCAECGAVVGDIEFDSRLQPGSIFPMRFPRALVESGLDTRPQPA